jgi:hypothetical protein
MPRRQKKYHYIYKTICLVTERYYIGMHSTDDLEDGYIGSGKRLRYSINKYGKENHKMEILEFLPNRKALRERERELITEEMILDINCMNLIQGGQGGGGSRQYKFTKEDLKKGALSSLEIIREKIKNDPEFKKSWKKSISDALKEKWKKDGHPMKGKNHSEETKKKMSESSKKYKGKKNSQYGTCWIHHLEKTQSKKIKKEDLDFYLESGWIKGRKMKF